MWFWTYFCFVVIAWYFQPQKPLKVTKLILVISYFSKRKWFEYWFPSLMKTVNWKSKNTSEFFRLRLYWFGKDPSLIRLDKFIQLQFLMLKIRIKYWIGSQVLVIAVKTLTVYTGYLVKSISLMTITFDII